MPRPLPRVATLLATFAVLLAGLLTATTAPASAKIWKVPAPNVSLDPLTHLTEFENRIVVQINKRRKRADLKPVRYFDSCVDGFSERWARHLAETGEFVHRNQRKILRRCDLTWVGETLVHSPEHRAVIMKPRANRAGVGVRLGGGQVYAVLNFGDIN